MGITRIDHLYAETTDWDATVSFWEHLGFAAIERWGSDGHRAGSFTCGEARIVIAEITDGTPEFNVFFQIEEAEMMTELPGETTPLSDTHWGTRWIRVTDPDGRLHALETSE
jgi:catechol 2,3-dioxygenase-like lactoylglutathione lyase family enzyme